MTGWPKLLGILLRIMPAPLRRWFYSFVAARRYRWFGRHETCPLPDPRQAHRYID